MHALGRQFRACFCRPVSMVYGSTMHWRHEPSAHRWVLRRSNALGAAISVSLIIAFLGTMLGGHVLGMLVMKDQLFLLCFVGAFAPFAAIRLGSATRFIVHEDNRFVREDMLYGCVMNRIEDSAIVTRWGEATFPNVRGPEIRRTAIWVTANHNDVIMATGSESDVVANVDQLPPPLLRTLTRSHTDAHGPGLPWL